MSHGQLREIRLRDFRCFGEPQTVRLAPLTLLVGENSTGKTSFLAAVRAIYDVAFRQREPDFREPPFDLGSFPEIVHTRGGRGKDAEAFEIGVKGLGAKSQLLDCNATFRSGMAAAPFLSEGRATDGSLWLRWWTAGDDGFDFELGLDGERWGNGELRMTGAHQWTLLKHSAHLLSDEDRASLPGSNMASTEPSKIHERELRFRSLVSRFENFFLAGSQPFASAPIHAIPRRTYDPTKLTMDPWGTDVPSRFASLQFQDKTEWTVLKEKLDAFGRESGLFDDFSVKQLTGFEGGPFQLQVRKFGTRGRKGPKRNLMDVGFGISQVLPVLAALFGADGPPLFLLQQPELHLHPSAQAALGSLFCRTAEADRQLIIETHSEYIIDRVRMDIRDRETALRPDDVSILFFERCDHDVRIHSLQFDDQGNVLGAPEGYGQFFMDETRRSVGL